VRRQSVANYYILNLAVADELFVLTLPLYCVASYTNDWPFGDAMCRLTYALRETNKYASLLTLVALSIDRCLATYHHLAHLRSITIGISICVVIWAVSLFAAGTPYAIYSQVRLRGLTGRRSCQVSWPWTGQLVAQRVWTYGQLMIGLVTPLVVIAVANALLLHRLRSFAGLQTANAATRLSRRRSGACDSSVRRQRASQNMARLVLAIVVIFVVCQLPYHIMEVLTVCGGSQTLAKRCGFCAQDSTT